MKDFRHVNQMVEAEILDRQIRAEFARQAGRAVDGTVTYVARTNETYRYSDRRQWERVDETEMTTHIPAPTIPEMGSAHPMTGEVAIPASAEVAEIKFDLNTYQLQWAEYLLHHSAKSQAEKWMDEFKPLLAKAVGDATLLTMNGRDVASFRRDARLNTKQLAKEQPQIIAQYTHIVCEEKFDEEAFRREMPAMHAAYRGRSLRLTA